MDILPYYTDGFFSSIFDFFPKKQFSSQKVQKNWKSKNGIKTALTPLFKELWADFGFVKFKNQIYPPQKNRESFDDLQIFDWYPAIFCHFWGQKYTSKSINFSIFGRDFGRVSLKNDQKWEILAKSLKILKVQKWYENGFNSINFSIFGRDFGRIMNVLPYYTDVFFNPIFDFFPKKIDFQDKKFKKTESQKMVSKRV